MKKTLILALVIIGLVFTLNSGVYAKSDTLKFGIDPDYPPWTWFEQGQNKGFDIEVLKLIADKNHLKYKFVALPWETAVPALAAGKINLLSGGLWFTCERDKKIDFTKPYYWEHANIVVSKKSKLNMATALCCGAKLGALAGSTNYEWIKALADNPKTNVTATAYESTVLAIKDLIAGRIDTMHIDSITAHEYAKKYPIKIIGTVFMYGETVFGVEEGDPHGLIPIFNDGFKWLWESGKFRELWEKYMPAGTSPQGPLPLNLMTKCK